MFAGVSAATGAGAGVGDEALAEGVVVVVGIGPEGEAVGAIAGVEAGSPHAKSIEAARPTRAKRFMPATLTARPSFRAGVAQTTGVESQGWRTRQSAALSAQ